MNYVDEKRMRVLKTMRSELEHLIHEKQTSGIAGKVSLEFCKEIKVINDLYLESLDEIIEKYNTEILSLYSRI